jgi:Na+:H+ antiporter, NhaA family
VRNRRNGCARTDLLNFQFARGRFARLGHSDGNDIAFALGALNLIAPRAPIGAKVLLTAMAIVDDMGSVLVISLFYSEAIVWSALGDAAVT